MGYGDQLIATGFARGANKRGKRIAFGDSYGRRIVWDARSKEIFQNNPNIAPPGSEKSKDLEWVPYYKGRRGYNTQDKIRERWIWNMSWRCKPGEMFFTEEEESEGAKHGSGFVVVEPNVEAWKGPVASNKDWGFDRYQEVVNLLQSRGHEIVQFKYDKTGPILDGVKVVKTRGFRHALSVMANAKMYLGPEGGLHHGAAALDLPAAVVIFGDWVPPTVTGYPCHNNFTGRSGTYCGSLKLCPHCKEAMDSIGVEEVFLTARNLLDDIEAVDGAGEAA